MSKRIKDMRWEINPPNPNKWLAHDISVCGKNIILKKYNEYIEDGLRDYLLFTLYDDGHSTNTRINSKNIDHIFSANFLPSGDIFIVGCVLKQIDDSFTFDMLEHNFKSGDLSLKLCILDKNMRIKKEKEITINDSEFMEKLIQPCIAVFSNFDAIDKLIFEGMYSDYNIIVGKSEEVFFTYTLYAYAFEGPKCVTLGFDESLSLISTDSRILGDFDWSPLLSIKENHKQLSDFIPPKNIPGKNWNRPPKIIAWTDLSKQPFAFLFNAGRKINVFKEGTEIEIKLKFGHIQRSPELFYTSLQNQGQIFNNKLVCMNLNSDASRLVVLSYLPYHSYKIEKGRYYKDNKSTFHKWLVKSYDIDGRLSEMNRTKLRIENKWKTQSERNIEIDKLSSAGLPLHIAELISKYKINHKEGIQLFRYLRFTGAPDYNTNEKDLLEKIDELVFSRKFPKEDAKWLIENREHVELIEAIIEDKYDIHWAKNLLNNMGFRNYPEAVVKVVEGSEPEIVAMIFGINSTSIDENLEDIQESLIEKTKEDEKVNEKAFKKFERKGRFS